MVTILSGENRGFCNKTGGSPGAVDPESKYIKSMNAILLLAVRQSKERHLFNDTFNQKRRERKRQAYLSRLWRMSEASSLRQSDFARNLIADGV